MATEPTRRRVGPAGGPDRVTVGLFALAAFLVVLAVLISQLPAATVSRPRVVLVRRLYQTTVVETRYGSRSAATVTQASSSSAAAPAPYVPAPTTRAS